MFHKIPFLNFTLYMWLINIVEGKIEVKTLKFLKHLLALRKCVYIVCAQ